MMHITRDLCGGQICVTPDFASFTNPETEPWLQQVLHDQRELAGGGPAQAARLRARSAQLRLRRAPPHVPALRAVAALCSPLAVYHNFDFAESMRIVRESAGLSEQVDWKTATRRPAQEDELKKTPREHVAATQALPSAPVDAQRSFSSPPLSEAIPFSPPSEASPRS